MPETQLMAILVTEDGPQDDLPSEPAPVHIHRTWSHSRYGVKIGFDLPAPWDDEDAKDALLAGTKYDRCHRQWNEQAKEWEADLSALNRIVDTMVEAGYDVTVDLGVAKEFESHGYQFQPAHRD